MIQNDGHLIWKRKKDWSIFRFQYNYSVIGAKSNFLRLFIVIYTFRIGLKGSRRKLSHIHCQCIWCTTLWYYSMVLLYDTSLWYCFMILLYGTTTLVWMIPIDYMWFTYPVEQRNDFCKVKTLLVHWWYFSMFYCSVVSDTHTHTLCIECVSTVSNYFFFRSLMSWTFASFF